MLSLSWAILSQLRHLEGSLESVYPGEARLQNFWAPKLGPKIEKTMQFLGSIPDPKLCDFESCFVVICFFILYVKAVLKKKIAAAEEGESF